MRRITDLKNKHAGQQCLIIGGGTSFLHFPLHKVPMNVLRIAVNDAVPADGADYVIYCDASFIRVIRSKSLHEKTTIIGWSHNYCNEAHYYYRECDVVPAIETDNTGLKAIIIARNIFGCSDIFLAGFDFYTREIDGEKQSHWYGDEVGHNKKYAVQDNLDSHYSRLSKMVEHFDKVKEMDRVYNCNTESALTVFPFGLPWEIGGRKIA